MSFLRDDLERDGRMYDLVHRKLEQMRFNEDTATPHIQDVMPAEVPKVPFRNYRLTFMAIAPFVILISLVGLFAIFGHDRH